MIMTGSCSRSSRVEAPSSHTPLDHRRAGNGRAGTRLNMVEILAGWSADYPDIDVETFFLEGPPRDTVAGAG